MKKMITSIFNRKIKNRGFTLIELLAVIVILAIVLVVTIPSVINSMNSAKESQLENATKSVAEWFTKQYELSNLGGELSSASPEYTEFVVAYGDYLNSYSDALRSSKNLEFCSEESLSALKAAGIAKPEDNIDLQNSYVWKDDNKIEVKLSAKENGTFYINGGIDISYSNSATSSFSEFRIYGNSVQNGTPTPSTPIEIESVGEKTKNLFSYKNTIIGEGSALGKVILDTTLYTPKQYKTNTQYTISFDFEANNIQYSTDGLLVFFIIEYTNGTSSYIGVNTSNLNNNNIVGTTISNRTIDRIYSLSTHSRFSSGTITIRNIQIEEGKSSTQYEPYGYKIPITVSDGTNSSTTNIYLDEPLRKVGNYADYIDYKEQKVYRNVIVDDDSGEDTIANSYSGTTDTTGTNITLPSITSLNETTTCHVDTKVQPSNVVIEY